MQHTFQSENMQRRDQSYQQTKQQQPFSKSLQDLVPPLKQLSQFSSIWSPTVWPNQKAADVLWLNQTLCNTWSFYQNAEFSACPPWTPSDLACGLWHQRVSLNVYKCLYMKSLDKNRLRSWDLNRWTLNDPSSPEVMLVPVKIQSSLATGGGGGPAFW